MAPANASPSLIFGTTASLSSTDALRATAALAFGTTANLGAHGKLDALASLIFNAIAHLTDLNAATCIQVAIASAIREIAISATPCVNTDISATPGINIDIETSH